MKSTDIANKWSVIRNIENDMRCYYYGSYKEFLYTEEEDQNIWVEVKFNDWTSQDLAEIFENELEDSNGHRWTWMPKYLLAQLIYSEVPEKERYGIMINMYMGWKTF